MGVGFVNDVQVWTVTFNPGWNALRHLLGVGCGGTYGDAGDDGALMLVLQGGFCAGGVELSLKPGKERFEPAAFFLQAPYARQMEFDFDRHHVHASSVA